jgi:hypothetical protein
MSRIQVIAFVVAITAVAAPTRAETQHPLAAGLPLFEAHSDFWMNLHHVLYVQAMRRRNAHGAKLWAPPDYPLSPTADELSEPQRRVWETALAYYERVVVDKDPLGDAELDRVNDILRRAETASSLSSDELPPGLRAVLNNAAPVYRATSWPHHDRANRAWIAAQGVRIQEVGKEIAGELARRFHSHWPAEPIRVDLVPAIHGGGAYTTLEPIRTTFAVLDPRHKDLSGLESLFHEAAHGLVDNVMAEIDRAAFDKNANAKSLWHAIQFYTVGETFAEHFTGYIPYGIAQGVYGRGMPYLKSIERNWKPYLEGKAKFAEAIDSLVADINPPQN